MTTRTNTDTTPRAWIGCLACYNDGRLVGDWVDAVRTGIGSRGTVAEEVQVEAGLLVDAFSLLVHAHNLRVEVFRLLWIFDTDHGVVLRPDQLPGTALSRGRRYHSIGLRVRCELRSGDSSTKKSLLPLGRLLRRPASKLVQSDHGLTHT